MYAPLVSLMITVPVFGQHEYTHALVADLEREGADYLIVDNRGDYPRIGTERVSTPGENLGWAGGSELGFRLAFAEGYSHAMTLNNDTRVSKGFVAALLDSRLPADAGMVGPMFDVGFPFAVADEKPAVTRSSPRSNASHNRSGESMPPGSRHPIPMTATGVTRVLSTVFVLSLPTVQAFASGVSSNFGPG